eukprot:4940867-Alexandrium_andersonii.AAC.1
MEAPRRRRPGLLGPRQIGSTPSPPHAAPSRPPPRAPPPAPRIAGSSAPGSTCRAHRARHSSRTHRHGA